ncbi:carbohydrate ABC transporter permease [Dactylosporangium vinaceum]|uniref:Carbohydrate ABC transporter permease n=1 Tax=Dactylosporangium vinaceum TaxID=53362 RepID=A0ABV5MF99_9ACTN|nr:carbohydrate ABC transporter permease [Dactylosporangium vinaceum]UAB92347.1 carbohydrate ABC transporter permease [Dactylosporangium vinaceum]
MRTLISPARLHRPGARRAYWIVVALVVVMFTIVFIGPLYWMVTGALKSGAEVAQVPPTLYPQDPQPGNYAEAWTALSLGRLLLNTVWYAFGALAFQLVFDVAAAYAFSKLRPAFGNVLLAMMLATLMIPSTVLVIPQYVTVIDMPLVHWNMLDSPWAIWLPAVTNAFNIFLLKRFFDSIPADLMAAAAIDGAGPLRSLCSIVLPISRPILGVVSIFSLTAIWKDFLWPLLVEPSPDNRTVNVGIYAFSQGLTQNVVIAGAVIAAVPTVVFFLIFQKNIMSGLTTGSLKG